MSSKLYTHRHTKHTFLFGFEFCLLLRFLLLFSFWISWHADGTALNKIPYQNHVLRRRSHSMCYGILINSDVGEFVYLKNRFVCLYTVERERAWVISNLIWKMVIRLKSCVSVWFAMLLKCSLSLCLSLTHSLFVDFPITSLGCFYPQSYHQIRWSFCINQHTRFAHRITPWYSHRNTLTHTHLRWNFARSGQTPWNRRSLPYRSAVTGGSFNVVRLMRSVANSNTFLLYFTVTCFDYCVWIFFVHRKNSW